jgi:hypothetical protein
MAAQSRNRRSYPLPRQGQPIASVADHETRVPFCYPTIPVPAAVLDGLLGMVSPVGGDALADTEALYDVACRPTP